MAVLGVWFECFGCFVWVLFGFLWFWCLALMLFVFDSGFVFVCLICRF